MGGIRKGFKERVSLQSTQSAGEIEEQFLLGVEDFEAGRYSLAIQRFDWVIEKNPNHTGAIEMLAQTRAIADSTATPTVVVPTQTPTLTPTPDLRSVEELFEQAQAALREEAWGDAIRMALTVRLQDADYEAVEIDSILFVAYRNRGLRRILVAGELEGGLNDFAQVKLFGPLDAEAQGASSWARFYIIGASFWELDWGQASFYFAQVAPFAPNLHDGTYWTAAERYDEALANYFEVLDTTLETSKESFCYAARNVVEISAVIQTDPMFRMVERYQNRCLEDEGD